MSKKRRRSERTVARTPHDLMVELHHLEIASGYDGLLRGAPEPVLVVGAYALAPTPRTLLRTIFRVDALAGTFPQTIPVLHDEQRARVGTGEPDPTVLLVVVGVEDDGGRGVSKVYGALERVSELALASLDRGDDVVTLAELALAPDAWREAKRALLLVDGLPIQALCGEDDDWVGAAAVVAGRTGGARRHRMHVAGVDLVNDWTAVFTTKIGWRA